MNSKERKESFNRFGDDLSELIVSYLSISDKIRFECISKQFKRLVFNKQKSLIIREFNYNSDNNCNNLLLTNIKNNNNRNDLLETIIKKFRFLREIQFQINWKPIDCQLLDAIQRNCNYLTTIQFMRCTFVDISPLFLYEFGRRVGHRLTGIGFESCVWRTTDRNSGYVESVNSSDRVLLYNEVNELLLSLLRTTPALKWFRYHSDPYRFLWHNYIQLFTDSDHHFKHLTQINISYGSNYQTIKSFADNYCKQLKIFTLTLNANEFQTNLLELNNTIIEISRFELLSKLFLTINHKNSNNCCIDSGLKLISESCLQLISFELNLFTKNINNLFTNYKLFNVLLHFRSLTVCKLKNIELNALQVPNIEPNFDPNPVDPSIESNDRYKSVGSFNGLLINTNLNKLELQISSLKDIHFMDIDLSLPNLKSITVSTDMTLTNNCLIFLSKLSHLIELEVQSFSCQLFDITDIGVKTIIERCPQIRSICLKCNTDITDKSLNYFIQLANKRPKISFELNFVTKNKLKPKQLLESKSCQNRNLIINDISQQFFSKYNYF